MLCNISALPPASDLYGRAFEHLIALELRAYISYHRLHQTVYYWSKRQGQEVVFTVGDKVVVEVKTTNKISTKHRKQLKLLQEENICERYFIVSHDRIEQNILGINCLYWENFLKKLWAGEIIKMFYSIWL